VPEKRLSAAVGKKTSNPILRPSIGATGPRGGPFNWTGGSIQLEKKKASGLSPRDCVGSWEKEPAELTPGVLELKKKN